MKKEFNFFNKEEKGEFFITFVYFKIYNEKKTNWNTNFKIKSKYIVKRKDCNYP